MKNVGVGIIGLGGISTKHIKELLACPQAEIRTICDTDIKTLERVRAQLQLPPEKCYGDYRALIADAAVDCVEICTPNYLHKDMAIAALKANKPVNIEKPIAMCLADAQAIEAAEAESKAFGMTCFSYRFMPAVRYAKHLVDDGAIGEIVGLNVAYLKCSAFWQGRKLEWRFIKRYAGSGVIGDLAVHLIDLAQILAGKMQRVCATTKIVIKERPRLDTGETAPVETEDMCSFLATFQNGASASFHVTRCAIGHNNTIRYDVYGTKGSISFDLDHPEHLYVCNGTGDPKHFKVRDQAVPQAFYLSQEQAFIDAVLGKRDGLFPTVALGREGQKIVDALIESAESGRPVTL